MSGRGILDADMTTVGGWLAQAARWWLGEMRAMVPPAMRDRFARAAALVEYHPASGSFTRGAGAHGGAPAAGAPVSVVLPAGLCLVRAMERPLVSERDLASMIRLEGARIMPLGEDGMLLAARILSRDSASHRMRSEVAGLPRAAAAQLGRALNEAAWQPTHIWVGAPQPSRPAPIDLLPALRDAGLVRPASRSAGNLWLVGLFLFALNLGLLVWRDAAATAAIDDMVTQQQPAVETARRITARIRRDEAIAAATIAARRTREPLAIMARIDSALPPGTWLARLNWQGDGVRLSGYRPARADVSAALRHAGFTVAHYGDTATTGQTRLGQPFELTLQLGKP